MDLIDESAVTPAEVEALARRLNMRLYRTCVKDNLNVTEVFEYLAAQYILKGGAQSGNAPAVAAVGDMGAEGGHRVPPQFNQQESQELREAEIISGSSPRSQRLSASPVKAAAPPKEKERIIGLDGSLEAVVERGGKKEKKEANSSTIKLGKDGRRERPKSKCC